MSTTGGLADPRELRRVLGGVMAVALAGCAVGPGKAADTDSDVTDDTSDTGFDSGDSGAGDSGDSGDSGVADSGDSGDSGPGDSGDSGDSGVADSGDSGVADSGDSGDSGVADSGDSGVGDSGDSGDSGVGGDSGDSGDSAAACADDLDAFPDVSDTGQFNSQDWSPSEAVAASGCDWPPGNDYVGATCTSASWDPLAELNLTTSLPNLLLVASWPWGNTEEVGRSGTPCADATDPSACMAFALDESGGLGSTRLISTSGDTYTVYDTLSELLPLLGTIDTAQEALLVAWFAGKGDAACSDTRFAARPDGADWEVVTVKLTRDCTPILDFRVRSRVTAAGVVTEDARQLWSATGGCIGRRPPGLRPVADDACGVGELLARHAELEHASVAAFHQIHAELEALGAPAALLAEVRRAARDERRHARQVGRLARRHGGTPRPSRVDPTPLRDAEALAIDNVREGCVGETWGALVGLWQAEHASDPAVAATMARVAADEVRHAALSWRIHGWLLPRLTPAARARVAAAQQAAVRDLPDDVEACEVLGLPGSEAVARLREGVVAALAA